MEKGRTITFKMLNDELVQCHDEFSLFFENRNAAQINCHLKQETSILKHTSEYRYSNYILSFDIIHFQITI